MLLVLAKLLVLFLGGAIVVLSYGAHQRSGNGSMLFVSLGFGLITLGSLVEGILYEFLGYNLMDVHIIESSIVLVGFLTLLYSLRRSIG